MKKFICFTGQKNDGSDLNEKVNSWLKKHPNIKKEDAMFTANKYLIALSFFYEEEFENELSEYLEDKPHGV